jgi:hypothetical protein
MPLSVDWHLAVRVLPIGITRESRVKPPHQDLPRRRGGALAPIRSYGEVLSLVVSHPRTVTEAPLRY